MRERLIFVATLLMLVRPGGPEAAGVVTLCSEDVQTGPAGTLNLQSALAGGGMVTFKCPGFSTIHISQGHTLSASTQFDGGGNITLDGFGATNLFTTANAGVVVSFANITLRNGHAHSPLPVPTVIGPAGVLQTEGTAQLDNVTINGAVQAIEASALVVRNSHFMSNSGEVLRASTIDLENSTFTDNDSNPVTNRAQLSPGRGALPVAIPGNLTIKGGRFENNGRPIVWSGKLIVQGGTVFVGNGRAITSGAPFLSGGALSLSGGGTIEKATFQNNTATVGGAIAINAGALNLRRDIFQGNRATDGGGAIQASEANDTTVGLTISYSRFENNTAKNGGAIDFEGGAHDSTLSATTVTFAGNTATGIGGAILAHGQLLLARAILVGNNAGSSAGAISADTATLGNAILARNRAPGGAGAVGEHLSLINSTVADNTGAGLVLQKAAGATLTLKNTIIANNSTGNCVVAAAAIVDKGNNLQFPGAGCGMTMPIADPKIDSFYIPYATSPVLSAGDDAACSAPPISAKDIYGAHRPYEAHCAIGAVEGTLESAASYVLSQTSQPPAPLVPLVNELNGGPPQPSPSGPPISVPGSTSNGDSSTPSIISSPGR